MKLYFTDQLHRLADNTILVGLCYHFCLLPYHKVVFILIAVCIVEGLDLSRGTAPACSSLIDVWRFGVVTCDSLDSRGTSAVTSTSQKGVTFLSSPTSLCSPSLPVTES